MTIEEGDGERLTVRSAEGVIELSVRFTIRGPVLTFSGADVELHGTRAVRLDCERLDIRAREGVDLETDGDLREHIAGSKVTRVGEVAELEAHSVQVTSRRGDVSLKANDDVSLKGERVLLND